MMEDGGGGLVGYDSSDSDREHDAEETAPAAVLRSAVAAPTSAGGLLSAKSGCSGSSDAAASSPRVKRARIDSPRRAGSAHEAPSDNEHESGGDAAGQYSSILDGGSSPKGTVPALSSSLSIGGRPASSADHNHLLAAREEPVPDRDGNASNGNSSDHLAESNSRGDTAPDESDAERLAQESHFASSLIGAKGSLLDALPPQSAADAPPAVLARFRQYLALSAAGHSFTGVLRRKREFGNPCVLDKVIAHFGIEQHGTAFPPSVFDPRGFDPAVSGYRALAEAQRKAEEERAAAQSSQHRGAIAFVESAGGSGGAAAGASSSSSGAAGPLGGAFAGHSSSAGFVSSAAAAAVAAASVAAAALRSGPMGPAGALAAGAATGSTASAGGSALSSAGRAAPAFAAADAATSLALARARAAALAAAAATGSGGGSASASASAGAGEPPRRPRWGQ